MSILLVFTTNNL